MTGTGGIMRKPVGEYAALFGGIEVIAEKYTEVGELVPAKFVGVMVTLLTALRIAQGKTLIVGDLFPREAKQKEILDQITGALEGCGVAVDVSIVDFKLMPEEVVEELNRSKSDVGIMDKWATASTRMGEALEDCVPSLKEDPAGASVKITTLLGTLANGSPEFKFISGEVQIAMDRVAARVSKAGEASRDDDALLHVLIKRLASYLEETWPALVRLPETRFVSALPKEDVVFGSFVMALLERPALAKDKYAMEFIVKGQEIVKGIVAKK